MIVLIFVTPATLSFIVFLRQASVNVRTVTSTILKESVLFVLSLAAKNAVLLMSVQSAKLPNTGRTMLQPKNVNA